MTCASCAARIEKKLNRMPGVEAAVNYATERAHVSLRRARTLPRRSPPWRPRATPRLPAPPRQGPTAGDDVGPPVDHELVSLRQRLLIFAVLTVPVVALAMVPPLQFANWQWLSLTLASPVVVWGAWPFHRAGTTRARRGDHGHADQHRRVGGYLWSLWALFFGDAGMTGMTMTGSVLTPATTSCRTSTWSRRRGHGVHPGRPLPRGTRQAQFRCRPARSAGHGRQGRRGPARRRRGAEPDRRPLVDDEFVVRRARRSPPTAWSRRHVGDRRLMLTGEPVPVEVGPGDQVVGATVNAGGRLVVEPPG